jgi:uncharacterized protein (TIGR03437 family)
MSHLLYSVLPLIFLSSIFNLANAQGSLNCTTLSSPSPVRGEGITERVGDIALVCSGGTPGAHITGNFSVILNVPITNRLAPNSANVVGVSFTVDNGSGEQPIGTQGTLGAPNALTFSGVSFTLSPTGTATLRLANIRANASQLMLASNATIQAFLTNGFLAVQNNQLIVGVVFRGLYAGFSGKLICAQGGSPLADDTRSLASFLQSRSAFSTTRVTEGFNDAFSPRGDFANMNADTGTRIMVRYSGFPQGARLFVPSVIAGSDAVQPTGGGDFGVPASGGQYAPGGNGSLLLARVPSADANGAGGVPVYSPGAPGSGTVAFDGMSEVSLPNGAGAVVFEVVDANPFIKESAQFPTFLSVPPALNGVSVQTSEDVSFAPVSTVTVATATDPIPRFEQISAPPDCTVVGDCALYFPRLTVDQTSLQYTAQAGGGIQGSTVLIDNAANGVMDWNTTIQYTNGSGWLRVSPTSGVNGQRIIVNALPGSLSPGTYNATLTVDAGPAAGTRNIPITFVITAAPPPPPVVPVPNIAAAVNAATFAAGPLAAGSLATLSGTKLSGNSVTVTFDGLPAQILYDSSTQVNVLVPSALGSKSSAQLVVNVDGNASPPLSVNLVPFAPGIFQNGILNQDNSVNSANRPAAPGSVIQIFATGLSGNGVITAKIGDRVIMQPYYAGPAPGLAGVQQVNLIVPSDISGPTASVSVCGGPAADQVVCSPTVQIAVAQ